LFDTPIGTPFSLLKQRFPHGSITNRDSEFQEYVVKIPSPLGNSGVASARVSFAIGDDKVVRIGAILKGDVQFDAVVSYLSDHLGQPSGMHQSLNRSWWHNHYCRVGPEWDDGCGTTVTLEGPSVGHRMALYIDGSGAPVSRRPPNNGLQPTGSAPSFLASCAIRTLRAAGG
jgi:hypothetical protein